MDHLVFNRKAMEFRYGSGTTVYSEKFVDGRLICTDYHASGMPQHPDDRMSNFPVPAFELVIDGCDASFGWEFENWTTGETPAGEPYADLSLNNPEMAIALRIRTLCGENGFFSRHMFLRNLANAPISLTHVAPLCGTLWELTEETNDYLQDYDLIPFVVGGFKDVHWGTEGNFDWRDVPYNASLEFGSSTGRSGHTHPFAIAHSKILGGYFVCQMEWGANWSFRFKNEFLHRAGNPEPQYKPCLRLCFALGPDAPAPMRVIDPKEEIEIPRIHFGYVCDDFDGAIQALHAYQRRYLLAKPADGYELISYDHWGYDQHNIREDSLLAEVERAASVGSELFIVDAGWFGAPGSDWWTTVGDWESSRLENNLYPVIDRAHELGMRFGLWIEPEAAGKDSVLAKQHPDWMITRYGQRVERSLDLARPEIEKYIEDQLMGVIDRYKLDLLRLDFNNQYDLEGGFNQRGKYRENTQWRYTEAVHRIFDHIRAKYPNLLLENCASGGGRTDLGMMSRFSKTQFSDWNRFPRIARTFNGMSMCLPPETLMMQYGAVQSAQRNGGAEVQMQMMVQLSPSISGLAPTGEPINPVLTQRLREYVTLYKDFIRPIQRDAKIYHHTPVVGGLGGRGWTVLEYGSADGTKGYAFLVRLPGTEEDTYLFKPRGLDTTRDYRITFFTGGRQVQASGFELLSCGIPIALTSPLLSQLLLFEALP